MIAYHSRSLFFCIMTTKYLSTFTYCKWHFQCGTFTCKGVVLHCRIITFTEVKGMNTFPSTVEMLWQCNIVSCLTEKYNVSVNLGFCRIISGPILIFLQLLSLCSILCRTDTLHLLYCKPKKKKTSPHLTHRQVCCDWWWSGVATLKMRTGVSNWSLHKMSWMGHPFEE